MCGICGIVNASGKAIQESDIKRMCDAMTHRGPDDEGLYIGNNENRLSVGLGHRRLSIIDLSAVGRQPMSNEDGTIWLTLNGEIYNYLELSKDLKGKGHKFKSNSDSEVIIHLYEELGVECVKKLEGMFAFAVWDANKNILILARDRPGKKPLLYYHNRDMFCFASEFTSILSSGLVPKEIDQQSIHYYLTFGYIPAPFTIYKNVFKLPPANFLLFNGNRIDIEKYWSLDFSKKIKISENDAADETLRLLKGAVRKRLYSDVPIGAFLSGGIDSSAVVGLMAELSPNRIKTFAIGFEDAAYNELEHAKRVAERFGSDHNEFIVKPKALDVLPLLVERYGEPYADSSAIPTYYVAQQTKQFVTVALNGDGGDEVFAGYERYQAMIISELYNQIPGFFRRDIIDKLMTVLPDSINPKNRLRRIKRFIDGTRQPLNQRYLQWVGIFDYRKKQELYSPDFANIVNSANPVSFIDACFNNNDKVSLLDRVLMLDTNSYLPDDLLVKVDIASMANSLEARSPFLDHTLMEFAASVPHQYKMKRFVKKRVLKNAVSKLIPKENIYRRKMGFGVPVGRWFRGELRVFLQDNLLSSESLHRGYFKPDSIKTLVKDHVKGNCDYSFQLWALLMLELWHKKFID